MPYEPSGFIAGLLHAEDVNRRADVQKAILANNQFDLQSKQLAEIAQRDMTEELKAASVRIKNLPPEEQAMELAGIAANHGKLGEASDLIKTSAASFQDRMTGEKTLLDNAITSANAAAAMLDSVTDGPSLEALDQRVRLQGIDTGNTIPMLVEMSKDLGFDSPEVQQGLRAARQAIVSKKDQAYIELQKAQAKTQEAHASLYRTQAALVPSQIRANDALATSRLKTGDKGTELNATDREAAKNLIGSRYDTTDNPAMLGVKASALIETQKDLLQQVPSLSKAEALEQAFERMDKDHEFAGLPIREQTMGTLEHPAPLPSKKENLQENEVYSLPNAKGKIVPQVWDGTNFIELGKGGG